jgi:hypothetical protein
MNHYEIKMIDTDPDTGNQTELVIAATVKENFAKMIIYSLNQIDEEPNRHYEISKFDKESCQ